MNYGLRNIQRHFCEMHGMSLIRIHRKIGCFLYIWGMDDQITTCAKWLNIKYELYGFIGDLIETIN